MTSATAPASARETELLRLALSGRPIQPRRHPWRIVGMALVTLLAVLATRMFVLNENMQWDVVAEYFFSPQILRGLGVTLQLTAITIAIGIVLGTVLAIARTSHSPFIQSVSWFYVWFFRGTPGLVQLIFWYNLATLLPELKLGLPFGGPALITADTNDVITPFTAVVLAFGLDQAAYMCEIIRSGLLSVDEGQREAAGSLGLTSAQTMRRIVLPQAVRVILPPTGNQLIGLLKYTSLVSILAVPDLLYSAQLIYSQNFLTIPLLVTAAIWYLIVTSVLNVGQFYIERHFAKGTSRALPALTPVQYIRNLVSRGGRRG